MKKFKDKTLLLGALGSALLIHSGFMHADGKGLVLEAGIYGSQLDEDLGPIFNDTDRAINVGIGWRFNEWIMLDVGYWDLGEYKSDEFGNNRFIRVDVSAWSAGAIVSAPAGPVDLYGRLGAASWEADTREVDRDGTDLFYGLGAAFNAGENFDLYIEWVHFDLDAAVDTLGIGLRYTF